MGYYDRYNKFRSGGTVKLMPYIKIPQSTGDIYITFNKSAMRMDSLSYKYYGDANYGWLILMANPELGGYEYSIEDGATLRIPYPLPTAINLFEAAVNHYKQLND